MRLLRFLPLFALLLCACEKPAEEVDSTPDSQPTADLSADALAKEEEIAAREAKIEELEREIENSTNLISDMEAFILMERAKVEDDPNYDQSFMEEALADQDEQRAIIKKAEEALKALEK